MQPDEEIQYAPRSRPVSFYDNYKDVPVMPPCVTSAMSVGNLNQVRDDNGTSQSNINNISGNNNINNNNNNNRVSNAISVGNVSKIPAAKVTGAVSTGNIGRICRGDKEKELGRAPSMANCLSTTVPVNLAASQIAGRHTPTRNSLRHSRMIVMHRTGHRLEKFLPPLVYYRRTAQCLAALQTILGVTVIVLSLWLLLWTPNLPVINNPYWSGIPLLLSGSFGISLLCCFKKEYPNMTPGLCLSITKAISVFLALLATVTCMTACIFSAMHLSRLMELECTPARVLNATCVCRPRGAPPDSLEGAVRYVDLNCPDVEGILTMLLIFSSACNGLSALVAVWYSYLHWSTRQKRPQYRQVRTNAVYTNNPLNSRPIYKPNPAER
ncbi:uncharacterized protein LOC116849221 [Odontomachus brunneus]|uniref:uncharacterized protein LOC116849221 n=1 Tax=Odontomachus brunneus TaxID=486640 RepID=UPI0013F20810|nr:uncharacterized protein LOC116849221 [Odontomachus brunneus]XP_032682041.1 uncharacterized protein LOC116849221 [Odontomachus brunneus]XP_032682042.1 uncharacterized protein LOC116849221 [Odontomachus brunneus]XP_032682043.1 uncharacterized protein LOC116849221 [Odontomachus brunneus]XP_032682044.1 uncharacterized protein LOC116849221 [Odontomachus brunneus]XP_032682045.1 uncharacterized protein LOC116849221 [Odontomachus brunneus]XP_032682046.1 uncharacterized protein LOC116849221 [Odonto